MNDDYQDAMDNMKYDAERRCEEAQETMNVPSGTLETIIREIVAHDAKHTDHGVGCACHDKHAATLRRLFKAEGLYETGPDVIGRSKSLRNLITVFSYVVRNP